MLNAKRRPHSSLHHLTRWLSIRVVRDKEVEIGLGLIGNRALRCRVLIRHLLRVAAEPWNRTSTAATVNESNARAQRLLQLQLATAVRCTQRIVLIDNLCVTVASFGTHARNAKMAHKFDGIGEWHAPWRTTDGENDECTFALPSAHGDANFVRLANFHFRSFPTADLTLRRSRAVIDTCFSSLMKRRTTSESASASVQLHDLKPSDVFSLTVEDVRQPLGDDTTKDGRRQLLLAFRTQHRSVLEAR